MNNKTRRLSYIPKRVEDARLRQASEKFIENEFEPPKAALGEYQDDTHSPLSMDTLCD